MGNPIIHAIVFVMAAIIPGGLIAYFGWRAYKKQQARKAAKAAADKVHKATLAFKRHFPVQSDSLRASSRRRRLMAYKTRPKNISPE